MEFVGFRFWFFFSLQISLLLILNDSESPSAFCPTHFESEIILKALGSLKEQPITIHNSNYVSTIYEKKAICACFGACRLPTNGAVLPIPALSAFTFPIFTSSVLRTTGMTHTLVTRHSCPPFFAATCSANAHPVSAAVYGAHF